MVLTHVSQGTFTSSASEVNIVTDSVETFQYHMIKIYTDNMLSGDKITIKIYDWDVVAASYKLFDTITLQDAQTNPVFYAPPLPQHRFQVSMQRTAGTDRSYNWERLSN